MSEHAWVLENIAGYVAGGLESAEREQLAQHVAGCPECARVLEETEALDRRLVPLFADERPSAALEDDLIQMLRTVPQRRRLQISWKVKTGLAVAAGVLTKGPLGLFPLATPLFVLILVRHDAAAWRALGAQ